MFPSDVLPGAVRRAVSRERLVAHVNPADLAPCREALPAILADTGRLEAVDEPRVGRGSCVLATAPATWTPPFESRLARIVAALAEPADESLVKP